MVTSPNSPTVRSLSYYLSQLCCYNSVLPQGSATSPALSNIVCRSFDRRLMILAKNKSLSYTRYADDITISGNRENLRIDNIITSIALDEGFLINQDKTRLLHSGRKMIVTGLDISTGKIRPPKNFRKRLENEIYYIWRYGLSGHVSNQKIHNPRYVQQLNGRIEFWRYIEPESPRLKIIVERFQSSAAEYLMPGGVS